MVLLVVLDVVVEHDEIGDVLEDESTHQVHESTEFFFEHSIRVPIVGFEAFSESFVIDGKLKSTEIHLPWRLG